MLKNGLTEEQKKELLKRYPPSENCLLLESTKINPEVLKVINEQVSRMDEKLCGLQEQIGAVPSVLGQLLTGFLSEEGGGNKNYIKLASDAAKLLLDFHQKQSITRRELIALNLRKDLKDTLTNNVSSDGWLFGDKLGDRVKAAKDLETSNLSLKQKVYEKTVPRPTSSDSKVLNHLAYHNREAAKVDVGETHKLPSINITGNPQKGTTETAIRADEDSSTRIVNQVD